MATSAGVSASLRSIFRHGSLADALLSALVALAALACVVVLVALGGA
jgi:hypothetical protein